MKKFFLACLFMLPAFVVSSQPLPEGASALTLEKIIRERYFVPKSIDDFSPMADGKSYTLLGNNQSIARYDYKSGSLQEIVFSVSQAGLFRVEAIDAYAFTADETRILITTGTAPIYRHSFEAYYYIYDRRQQILEPLVRDEKLQLATFSPDGNQVAFVQHNNLFVKNLNTGEIKALTSDGKLNSIINGAPDWVYEEEFGFSQAYCWSPDSRKIAYYRFDESAVKEFEMTIFESLYPETSRYKYPKAGEDNSVVSIHIADLAGDSTIAVDIGGNADPYIPRIKWTCDPDKLSIVRLNREQNQVDVLLAEASTGRAEVLYSETNRYFISEINDQYISFLEDRKHFIIRSEKDGYFHFYRYALDGAMVNQITCGEWDTDELLGIDQKRGIVYYTSAESSPLRRDVYAINLNGSGKRKLSTQEGTNRAAFSADFRYYISFHSAANQPPFITLCDNKGKTIRVLEDNAELKERMKKSGFTPKEFITIPVSDDLLLNAYIIRPPGFSADRQYPVLMNVYGGPESQSVTDGWDNGMAWEQMLAKQGYIVVCVDNRGTDGRGEAFRKATYLQLGRLETEDQTAAAEYLASLPYVNKRRIGIWGWSYGGTMSLLCLMKGSGVFSTAIAVSPVTSWRFYDTIYTERFMRKPLDNSSGYDDNSPINHVDKLKGNLLLIHGTADDNVHVQHSMELAKKLIQADKKFDMAFYPDKNHGIYGGNTRLHLYRKMTDFIITNL